MPFFDQFRPKRPVMNMCMMGPKAVGKTTVMTAVFNETQTSIYGTSLNLTAKGDTGAELMDACTCSTPCLPRRKTSPTTPTR